MDISKFSYLNGALSPASQVRQRDYHPSDVFSVDT